MTFTRPHRAPIAHHGLGPDARRHLPRALLPNLSCCCIRKYIPFPRWVCLEKISFGILTSLEFHIKPRDPSRNSTGHIGSGVGVAATSSRSITPSSQGTPAPRTTPSSDPPVIKVGAVRLWRPSPLQPLSPSHKSVAGNQAVFSTAAVLSSSRATSTSNGAGSLSSTDRFLDVVNLTRGSLSSSRDRSASAPAPSAALRVYQPSHGTSGRVLASGCYNSSTPTWSPCSSVASLAPASSANGTLNPGSANGGNRNSSAGIESVAAPSGTGEDPRLIEYLDSIKNRTKSRTRFNPRPHAGALTGSDSISSTKPYNALSDTGGNSLLTEYNVLVNGSGVLLNGTSTEPKGSDNRTTHRPVVGFSPFGYNGTAFNPAGHSMGAPTGGQYPTNCSGLVTITAHVEYEVVTSTILVNETVTLGPNATTPLPVLITPPSACQTITVPCEMADCPSVGPRPKAPVPLTPYTPPTSTSTLLVTKKSPAVVQQSSVVGNLFGPSTSTPQALPAQPTLDNQQAAGQNSGSSSPDMSTQSDDSNSSDSNSQGQSPEKSTPQQDPTNEHSPSASSTNQNPDLQNPGTGSSGGQHTGSDDQTAPNGDQPSGADSNRGSISNNGDASNHEGTATNGDTSNSGGTANSGNTNTGGGASNDGINSNPGGTSSNGGISDSGNTDTEGGTPTNGGVVTNKGASSHEGVSSNGGALNNEGSASNSGGVSSNGAAAPSNGEGSSDGDSPEPKAGSSVDSHGTQYVPKVVMAGNLPVSIVSNAVIVGSHTVNAGSPPTTVVANDQMIIIQPSQIVAQGNTIAIQAVVTPPPTSSATIGNVPVVLRPQDVAIGSTTYERGSSPTSVVYNGETYRWDASHLVGAGAMVAFPSADSSAPRVTAGGQVFSVFPSQLKASGRDILLPDTPKASPFVYKGQTFSVNPSQIIAPDTSITLPPANKVTPFIYIDHSLSVDASQFMARSTTIPLTSGAGVVTYNGQVLTVKPSEIIGPSTTIALSAPDDSAVSPTAVTTGGLTFSMGPSAAVIGSSTYSFVPGKAAATIMTHGEAVLVGSNGVQFGNVHVQIPTITPSFSAITQGDLTLSVNPSKVVVGGHTDNIYSDMTPITTVFDGHTISIGPKGVGLPSTTISLPSPKPSFSIAIDGDLTFSVAPSKVVVEGKTYSIASNKAPITTAIDGQIMTIGPKGIHLEGTTVDLPVIQTPMVFTAGGLIWSVGATDAVISGTTYAIGSGAPLQTAVVGSQTIEIGSAGVVLPSTTIAPKQTPTAVVADGLTFSVDSTEGVINGTTYAIGSGAVAKTLIEGSLTMILGTDGIALPSTTIKPWSSAAQTGFSSVLGTSGPSSAATATGTMTPIVTGKEGGKKQAAGDSTRIPNSSSLLALVLGIMLLGMRWM